MHGLHSAFLPSACLAKEVHANVIAELNTKAETSHQVDDHDGVDLDRVAAHHHIEHPADAHELVESEEDTEANQESDVEAGEDLKGNDNCTDSDQYILEEHSSDVCILVVIDIV